ncbi:NADH-quinone oxidoreductase subunit NuoE [bacterium]|nr:NADH-quinone oxidoreductase subunit NuoE [candidate division CSSED10-310 bacterium]
MAEDTTAVVLSEEDLAGLDEILLRHDEPGGLIPILQATQNLFGYLPAPAISRIAAWRHEPESAVYGVATFYSQFHLKPKGTYVVRICKGTACHVGGAEAIADAVTAVLGIADGETSEDMKFTMQSVACLGCCSLAPVMMINDEVFGRLNKEKVPGILAQY